MTLRRVILLLLTASLCSAQMYTISTVAGGGPLQTPVPALGAAVYPSGIASDAAGNVYFTSGNCIFRVDTSGIMARFAGTSRVGYSGDGGQAINAQFRSPAGLAFDAAGNLFVADVGNFRIRRIDENGIVTTVAGSGVSGNAGDGGPAVNAQLHAPSSIAIDAQGNFYIGDATYDGPSGVRTQAHVRKVSPAGVISRVAAGVSIGSAGGLALDSAGNLFIADAWGDIVWKVFPDGTGIVIAGSSAPPGGNGTYTHVTLIRPNYVAVDSLGDMFIGCLGQIPQGGYYASVIEILASGAVMTVAGGGQVAVSSPPPPAIPLYSLTGIALRGTGDLLISDGAQILELTGKGATKFAGGASGVGTEGDGPAANAQLQLVGGMGIGLLPCIAVDSGGNLYISENTTHRVRKVGVDGVISTFAGTGQFGSSGDGGPAGNAQLWGPSGLWFDGSGNLYIWDEANARIRKVSPQGIITTALDFRLRSFFSVSAVTVDGAGNIFLGSYLASTVHRFSPDGTETVVAGNGQMGNYGDGGPATSASLYQMFALSVDSVGNLYISGYGGIRKVGRDGIINKVPGTSTSVNGNIAVDAAGNIFIADGTSRILRLDAGRGSDVVATTIAGNGVRGYSGDDGPAIAAQMSLPWGIALDAAGNIYLADTVNNVIRLLRPVRQQVLISAVVDAASETAGPVAPGKVVVIYGAGFSAASTVAFNGIPAPVIYSTPLQLAAVIPYGLTGTTAAVTASDQGNSSLPFYVAAALAAPSIFTSNLSGAGQAAAVNLDGTLNSAVNPVAVGSYISLYATGEGQTSPAGVDGKLAGLPLPHPLLPVSVTIDGFPAVVQYAGAAPGEIAGLMQVNVQVPAAVRPGGYVPVVLSVGNASSGPGVTIAVGWSLETMTPEERMARAKRASTAAAVARKAKKNRRLLPECGGENC